MMSPHLYRACRFTIFFLFVFAFSGEADAQTRTPHTTQQKAHDPVKDKKTPSPKDSVKARDYYVEMKGNVRHSRLSESDETAVIDSALITIYSGDIPYSEIWTGKKGKCSFRLPLDKIFRIEVSKKGYVSKFFEVNTKVPPEKKSTFSFYFDIDIFEDVSGLDVTVLKKPIAKVAYNSGTGEFAYDVSYTSRINSDIRNLYKNYYLLQKIAADSALKNTVPPHK